MEIELDKSEVDLLLRILDTSRVDSIVGDNNLDQDDIGRIMAKLGDESMKILYEE
jgi:hypothetical protein